MNISTKDKIKLTYWHIDKYIKQVEKYGKVNKTAISPDSLIKAKYYRKYIKRLYKDIMAIGYKDYRITKEELLELNKLYARYKICLNVHPQYKPPRIRRYA